MATTVTYTGDGSSNVWTVPFDYLKKSHIVLTVDGVPDTTFTWVTDSSIAASSTPADTVAVVISRNTPRDGLVTTIPASGTFRGRDINNQSLQALYVAEEGYSALTAVMSKDLTDNTWEAENIKIKNVATPTADHHAARKDYVDVVAGSASAAAASAAAALSSEGSASTSASNASASASAASASETAAGLSETAAAASETAAGLSETAAAASESAAAASAISATASQNAAFVSAGDASTSASNASSSESNAATSASNASTSETNAAASAVSAAASAALYAGYQSPGGRLTATSGERIPSTIVDTGTVIYYTPVFHAFVPLYDGTSWEVHEFTELTNTFSDATKNPAATATNSNYDLFVWDDAGTVRLSRGPAWTDSTNRSAGTALTSLNGRYVNNTGITNGPLANRGLYVGSMRTNGSNQLEARLFANGVACNFLFQNWYNQLPVTLLNDYSGGSHTYGTNTTRRLAGDAATDFGIFNCIEQMRLHGQVEMTSGFGGVGSGRGLFGMGNGDNTLVLTGSYSDSDGITSISVHSAEMTIGMGFRSVRTLELAPTGLYTGYRGDSKGYIRWMV